MEKNFNLKEMDLNALKGLAYDLIVQRDLLNRNLSMVTQEIEIRRQTPAEPKNAE
jgi:hypothetical protein